MVVDEQAMGQDRPLIDESDLVQPLDRCQSRAVDHLAKLGGALRRMDGQRYIEGVGLFLHVAQQFGRTGIRLPGGKDAADASAGVAVRLFDQRNGLLQPGLYSSDILVRL